jgi:TatD DNase family protein
MLFDTHSHLNFKAYDKDRNEVIKRTQKEGVVCIDVGTKYETSKNAVELAEKNENIYAAIGMHPIHIKDEYFDKEKYRELAKSKKVVAIGEIGLDNKYPNPGQEKVFVEQLDLAEELDLPVIVHVRMAHEDLYKILLSRTSQNLRGVIHCFTGNWEEAQRYLALGFYLGINGIIFKFDIDEVIKKVPLDKILIETDCPYLTPLKAGVERNEPIFVKYVAERIAELRGISFDEVVLATTANAKKLFGI